VQIVGFQNLPGLIVDHCRHHIISGPFNQPRSRFSLRHVDRPGLAFQLGAKVFEINANNPYGMVKK